MILTNLPTKQKETHSLREQTEGCQGWGEDWGERIIRALGVDMCTLLYLKWIINKDLLYSTCDSTQRCVAAWIRGEFRGEWIYIYICLNPFAVHFKLSQNFWLISYTTTKIKKYKNAYYYSFLRILLYSKYHL